jgi:hypothetical protein
MRRHPNSFWHSLFDGGGVPQYYIMVDRPDMISIGKWLVYGEIDGWGSIPVL